MNQYRGDSPAVSRERQNENVKLGYNATRSGGQERKKSAVKPNSMVRVTLTLKKDELARTSKTSKLLVNYQHMLGIARALVAADRMGSWEMHLSAVSACLPIFAAAGHPNYLKSAHLYLQKIMP